MAMAVEISDQHDVLLEQPRQLRPVRQPEREDATHDTWQPPDGRHAVEKRPDAGSSTCATRAGVSKAIELARLHDADPVAKRKRLAHVVGDEDDAVVRSCCLSARELAAHFRARDRIERAERFVHQQNRRIDGERACQADALPLPAGQFVGTPRGEGVRRQSDQVEQFARPRAVIARRSQPSSRGTTARFLRPSCAERARVLQDVSDAAPQPDRVPFLRVASLDRDASRGRQQQPIDELEQRALAGAAAADDRDASRQPGTRDSARVRPALRLNG